MRVDSREWVACVDNWKCMGIEEIYIHRHPCQMVCYIDTESGQQVPRGGQESPPAKKQKKCLVRLWIWHKMIKKFWVDIVDLHQFVSSSSVSLSFSLSLTEVLILIREIKWELYCFKDVLCLFIMIIHSFIMIYNNIG